MIAEELCGYLEFKGHGTKNASIFLGFQPDHPDNCITVYDESAPVPEESHALSVDEFGIQILVRNEVYSVARELMRAIHQDLVGFGGEEFVPNGQRVHAVFIASPPASIGRDEKGRSEWTSHYRMRVESEGDSYRL
jgi:hypothetical protein